MFFFFNDTATTEIYTLSLHDALPIFDRLVREAAQRLSQTGATVTDVSVPLHRDGIHIWNAIAVEGATMLMVALDRDRSEEHTSELQSHLNLVCRLLLEKKQSQRPNT